MKDATIRGKDIDTSQIKYLVVEGDAIDIIRFPLVRFYEGNDLNDATILCIFEFEDGSGDADILTKELSDDEGLLYGLWEVKGNASSKSGKLQIQLKAIKDGTVKFHTKPATITVEASLTPEELGDFTPTVLDQYLTLYQGLVAEAEGHSLDAQAAQTAAENARDSINDQLIAISEKATKEQLVEEIKRSVDKDNEHDFLLSSLSRQVNKATESLYDGDIYTYEEDVIVNGVCTDMPDISSTVVEGRFGSMLLKGKSGENLVINCDFSDGTTGWFATGYGTLSASNNILSLESTTADFQVITKKIGDGSFTVGDKLFVVARLYFSNVSTASTSINIDGSSAGTIQQASVIVATGATSAIVYGIVEVQSDFSGDLVMKIVTGVPIGETVYIDGNYGVMAQNLTQQGLATYLSIYDKANRYFNFIIGSAPSLPYLWESKGANLFDKSKATLGYAINITTGVLVPYAIAYVTDYIQVSSSTDFFWTWLYRLGGSNNSGIVYFDAKKSFISGETVSPSADINFTTPSNCAYVRITGNISKIDTDMLNLGSSSLPYEPYKVQQIQIPYLGYRLPNGVANTYVPETGVETRNVSEDYELKASDITTQWSSNVQFVRINLPTDAIQSNGIIQRTDLKGYRFLPVSISMDNASYIGFYREGSSAKTFDIAFELGTYASLAEAQADVSEGGLVGTIIRYQLATPEVIQHAPQVPTLNPNGSQYLTPSYATSYITDASSQFTIPYDTDSIDSVMGYDEEGEYEVPSSGYSLSGNIVTMLDDYAGENRVWYVRANLDKTKTLTPTTSGFYPVSNVITRIEALEAWILDHS